MPSPSPADPPAVSTVARTADAPPRSGGALLHRPLVPVAIGSAMGILAGLYLPAWVMAGFILGGTALTVECWRKGQRKTAWILGASTIAAVLFMAHTIHRVETHAECAALAQRFSYAVWTVTPEPIGTPLPSEKGLKTLCRIDAIASDDPDAMRLIGRRVQISIQPMPDAPAPDPDRAFRGRVRLLPEKGAMFPGAFSLSHHARRQNILAYGILREWTQEPPQASRVWQWIGQARRAMVANTNRVYRGTTGAFLAALLFGERSRIPEQVTIDFRVCGLSHLIAISGLNVGLVAGFAWFVFRFGLRQPQRRAAIASILCIVAYALVSGGQPSAVRATVMGIFYFAGFCIGRRNDLLNAMGASAILIVAQNPLALTDAGFLLSYGAVLFLSRFANEAAGLVPARQMADSSLRCRIGVWCRRLAVEIWQLFLLGLAALAGTAPLSAAYFHLFSFSGLILNLFAIPWMAVVLVMGFAGQFTALYPDPTVARLFAGVFAFPADLILWIAATTRAHAPFAIGINEPTTWGLAAYYLAFGAFFCRRTFGWTTRKTVPCVIAGTIILLISMQAHSPAASDRLTVLDVASRLMVLERHDGRIELSATATSDLDDAITLIRANRATISADRPVILHAPDDARETCRSTLQLLLGPVVDARADSPTFRVSPTGFQVRLSEADGQTRMVGLDIPEKAGSLATAATDDFRLIFLPWLGKNGWTRARELYATLGSHHPERMRFLHSRDARVWEKILTGMPRSDIDGAGALCLSLDHGMLLGETGSAEGWTRIFAEPIADAARTGF